MLRNARTRREKSKNFWGAKAGCSSEGPTIRVGGLTRTKRSSSSNVVSHPCLCEPFRGVLELHTQHLPRHRDGGRLGRLGLEARANESSHNLFSLLDTGE